MGGEELRFRTASDLEVFTKPGGEGDVLVTLDAECMVLVDKVSPGAEGVLWGHLKEPINGWCTIKNGEGKELLQPVANMVIEFEVGDHVNVKNEEGRGIVETIYSELYECAVRFSDGRFLLTVIDKVTPAPIEEDLDAREEYVRQLSEIEGPDLPIKPVEPQRPEPTAPPASSTKRRRTSNRRRKIRKPSLSNYQSDSSTSRGTPGRRSRRVSRRTTDEERKRLARYAKWKTGQTDSSDAESPASGFPYLTRQRSHERTRSEAVRRNEMYEKWGDSVRIKLRGSSDSDEAEATQNSTSFLKRTESARSNRDQEERKSLYSKWAPGTDISTQIRRFQTGSDTDGNDPNPPRGPPGYEKQPSRSNIRDMEEEAARKRKYGTWKPGPKYVNPPEFTMKDSRRSSGEIDAARKPMRPRDEAKPLSSARVDLSGVDVPDLQPRPTSNRILNSLVPPSVRDQRRGLQWRMSDRIEEEPPASTNAMESADEADLVDAGGIHTGARVRAVRPSSRGYFMAGDLGVVKKVKAGGKVLVRWDKSGRLSSIAPWGAFLRPLEVDVPLQSTLYKNSDPPLAGTVKEVGFRRGTPNWGAAAGKPLQPGIRVRWKSKATGQWRCGVITEMDTNAKYVFVKADHSESGLSKRMKIARLEWDANTAPRSMVMVKVLQDEARPSRKLSKSTPIMHPANPTPPIPASRRTPPLNTLVRQSSASPIGMRRVLELIDMHVKRGQQAWQIREFLQGRGFSEGLIEAALQERKAVTAVN